MSSLTRLADDDYRLRVYDRAGHAANVFFHNHEESRAALDVTRPVPPDVVEENVKILFEQTRGGAFKIPDARYTVPQKSYDYSKQQHTTRPKTVSREELYKYTDLADEDVGLEPGELYARAHLVPCTYDVR